MTTLGIHDFWVFLLTGILLNLTPGQDTLYILGRSIAQGRGAGVAAALGISTGSLVHTMAAALGLSAVLAASSSAFWVVKLAGASYLAWLGARMLFARRSPAACPGVFAAVNFGTAYRQGILTNVLNPKVALFFLAFLPQFIAADSPHKFTAFLVLGLSFIITGTLWCLALACFAARLGHQLRSSSTAADLLNRAAGALFIALGVKLATVK